jgi:cytochrome c553
MTMFPKDAPVRLKGKAMEALRREVWWRAGKRCEVCNFPVPLDGDLMWRMHLAHRNGRGANGEDTADNTRCLCAKCHGNEHNAGGKPVPAKEIA